MASPGEDTKMREPMPDVPSTSLREAVAEQVASAQHITRIFQPSADGLTAVSPLPKWCYETADAVLVVTERDKATAVAAAYADGKVDGQRSGYADAMRQHGLIERESPETYADGVADTERRITQAIEALREQIAEIVAGPPPDRGQGLRTADRLIEMVADQIRGEARATREDADGELCGVCDGRGWHTAGGNEPTACGECPAGEAWAGEESE